MVPKQLNSCDHISKIRPSTAISSNQHYLKKSINLSTNSSSCGEDDNLKNDVNKNINSNNKNNRPVTAPTNPKSILSDTIIE